VIVIIVTVRANAYVQVQSERRSAPIPDYQRRPKAETIFNATPYGPIWLWDDACLRAVCALFPSTFLLIGSTSVLSGGSGSCISISQLPRFRLTVFKVFIYSCPSSSHMVRSFPPSLRKALNLLSSSSTRQAPSPFSNPSNLRSPPRSPPPQSRPLQLTEFMQEMDGLQRQSEDQDKGVIVVGATNRVGFYLLLFCLGSPSIWMQLCSADMARARWWTCRGSQNGLFNSLFFGHAAFQSDFLLR
jgi:hypothetical protein